MPRQALTAADLKEACDAVAAVPATFDSLRENMAYAVAASMACGKLLKSRFGMELHEAVSWLSAEHRALCVAEAERWLRVYPPVPAPHRQVERTLVSANDTIRREQLLAAET